MPAPKRPGVSSSDPGSTDPPGEEASPATAAPGGGRRKRRKKGHASLALPPPHRPGRPSDEKAAQPFPQLDAFEPRYWPNKELCTSPPPTFRFAFLPHLSLLSNPCVRDRQPFRPPSWSQANPHPVPPLPPLADPELFIQFHDAIRDPLNKPNEKYDNFRLRMTSPFSVLAKRGDGILNIKCLDIIYEYFGPDNPRLVNMIHDHLVSNEVWKELAVAYKLPLYIGVARTRYDDKWWADVWEAYWGALFIERQFWNDNEEDLTAVLRRLVYIQCKAAYEHLVNFPFHCLSPCPLIVGPLFKDPDLDIEPISNPPYLHTSKGLENTILGYRVQIKETGVFACAQDEEQAKTKLYFSSHTPWGKPPQPHPRGQIDVLPLCLQT